MTVARVTEIIASSRKSFEDAVENGIHRAGQTVRNIRGAWIKDMKVTVKDGKIEQYRVGMQLTFVLDEDGDDE